jgi:hypothetical protein
VLTSITAYQSLDRESLVDADGTAITNFTIENPSDIESYSQELRVSHEAEDGSSFIIGANYQYDDIDENSNATAPVASFPFTGADAIGTQTAETIAVFGNADWY